MALIEKIASSEIKIAKLSTIKSRFEIPFFLI
jgi:hypothetical protein